MISRSTIEHSIDGEKAETYRIVLDGEKVGDVEGHWSMDDEMFVFRKVISD